MEKNYNMSPNEIVELVKEVAEELKKKGLVPYRTLTDYVRSGDPTYMNQLDKELRIRVCRIDPIELLDAIWRYILD